jgi:hypothetical protein
LCKFAAYCKKSQGTGINHLYAATYNEGPPLQDDAAKRKIFKIEHAPKHAPADTADSAFLYLPQTSSNRHQTSELASLVAIKTKSSYHVHAHQRSIRHRHDLGLSQDQAVELIHSFRSIGSAVPLPLPSWASMASTSAMVFTPCTCIRPIWPSAPHPSRTSDATPTAAKDPKKSRTFSMWLPFTSSSITLLNCVINLLTMLCNASVYATW